MGAVKAHEVERALARLDPAIKIVLIYGPDHGLVSERAASLARAHASDPDDPFVMVRLDGGQLLSDPMRLADEADTIGLFGGKRVIRVSPPPRPITAAVEPLLRKPPTDALVIIEAGDLQRSNPLRTMVERAPSALAAPCYRDEARGLEALIDPVLREHGLTIDRDARSLLVARLGADRQVSRREIEKVAVYAHGAGQVTAADIEAIVGDSSAREAEDVVDAAFGGDLARLDQSFARLRAGGEDAGVLIGFTLRHGLALLAARADMDATGRQPGDAAAAMRGIPYPRRGAVEAALRRLTTAQLVQIVAMLEASLLQSRRTPALAEETALRALWNVRRL